MRVHIKALFIYLLICLYCIYLVFLAMNEAHQRRTNCRCFHYCVGVGAYSNLRIYAKSTQR